VLKKNKKILVVGSLAYDHVMLYDGSFKDVILPEHYSFAVTAINRRISYGGCGGNIAYNLKLLGENPVLIGIGGSDFDRYRERLNLLGIDASNVLETDQHLTAAAFICTDNQENQITFFDAGAMVIPTAPALKKIEYRELSYAIIAPDNPARMIKIAKECFELSIPFIFDPAQEIEYISVADLTWAVTNCYLLIVNDYEADLLAKKLCMPRVKLQRIVGNYIETHGPHGCTLISSNEGARDIKAVKAYRLVDPTGCGDAFRAGVLMGLSRGFKLDKACKIGALTATYNLEHAGTQNHIFTFKEFKRRFEDSFNESIV